MHAFEFSWSLVASGMARRRVRSTYEVVQHGGHTPEKAWPGQASYMLDIDHPPLVKKKKIIEVCRTLYIFFSCWKSTRDISFHYTNRLGEKAAKAHRGNENLWRKSAAENISSLVFFTPSHLKFLCILRTSEIFSYIKKMIWTFHINLNEAIAWKGGKSLVCAVHFAL